MPLSDAQKSIFCSLISSNSVSFASLFFKLSNVSGNQSSFAFGLIGTFLSLAFFAARDRNEYDTRKLLKAVILGVVFAGPYTYLYIISLNYITAGDTLTVNIFTSFATSVLFEIIHLKQKPHILTIVAGILGITGLVLITQPTTILAGGATMGYLFGVVTSFISGILGSLYYVFLHKQRSIGNHFHWFCYVVGTGILAAPEEVVNKFTMVSCDLRIRMFALFGSVLYAVAVRFYIPGSMNSLPSVSFIIKLSSIITMYILQIVVLGENVSLYSAIGAGLITLGISLQSSLMVKCK